MNRGIMVYAVYDKWSDWQCVCVGSCHDVAHFLGIKYTEVSRRASADKYHPKKTDRSYDNSKKYRYKLERVGWETEL